MAARRVLGRRGLGPLLGSALGAAVLVALWNAWAAGRFPQRPRTQWRVPALVSDEAAELPVLRFGAARPGGLLLVGDSRAEGGFVAEEFDRAGVGPTAVLAGPSGQLLDLLRIARTMPPRRMVMSLTPLSVWDGGNPHARNLYDYMRRPLDTQRVDEILAERLEEQRAHWLHRVFPAVWNEAWFAQSKPGGSVRLYRNQLLAAPTRAVRAERLELVRGTLAEMREEGWDIVCVRMPISPALRRVEDAAFPPDLFRTLCDEFGIPYLDMSRQPFATKDGSHLLPKEAQRFCDRLAARVAPLWRGGD